jgi:hypothetical protein
MKHTIDMVKVLESMLSKNPKTMRFCQFLRRNVMLEKVWQISPTATQCQGAHLANLDVSPDFKSLGGGHEGGDGFPSLLVNMSFFGL